MKILQNGKTSTLIIKYRKNWLNSSSRATIRYPF